MKGKIPFGTFVLVLVSCGAFFGKVAWQMWMEQHHRYREWRMGLTPLERVALIDFPDSIERVCDLLAKEPYVEGAATSLALQQAFSALHSTSPWMGIGSAPCSLLFLKVRQYQVWRLITPIFLHGSLLHLLCNMGWLLILGAQIEPRVGMRRFFLLVLLLSVFSNVVQYVLSGPYFMGFSGVILGLVGFVWSAKKKQQEYPLSWGACYFVGIFALVAALLSCIPFLRELGGISLAHGAHMAGGVLGVGLGRLSFFMNRKQYECS